MHKKFMRPNRSQGAKVSVRFGRVWTEISVKVSTNRLAVQAVRAAFGANARIVSGK